MNFSEVCEELIYIILSFFYHNSKKSSNKRFFPLIMSLEAKIILYSQNSKVFCYYSIHSYSSNDFSFLLGYSHSSQQSQTAINSMSISRREKNK